MAEEEKKVKNFEFEAHQISVGDAALLLNIKKKEVLALINLGHLRAEGQKPYKIDVRSIVEYKRIMPSTENEED